MICRFLKDNVCEALGIARVVHLTGIRQCGKTTLVESVALGEFLRSAAGNSDVFVFVVADFVVGIVCKGIKL